MHFMQIMKQLSIQLKELVKNIISTQKGSDKSLLDIKLEKII